MLYFDAIRKALGYHVCGPFTPWTTQEASFTRPPNDSFEIMAVNSRGRISYTRRWQERTCTTCGKMQQRELEW